MTIENVTQHVIKKKIYFSLTLPCNQIIVQSLKLVNCPFPSSWEAKHPFKAFRT